LVFLKLKMRLIAGNVRVRDDAVQCLNETGADAVMSACGLLSNPKLFDEQHATSLIGRSPQLPFDAVHTYVDYAQQYHATRQHVSKHLYAMIPPAALKRTPPLAAMLAHMPQQKAPLLDNDFDALRGLLRDAEQTTARLGFEQDARVCRYWARGHCSEGGDDQHCEVGLHALPLSLIE
jgi:tRNA-dihydrouridine synthase